MQSKQVVFRFERVTVTLAKASLHIVVLWSRLGFFALHNPVDIYLVHLASRDTEGILLCSCKGIALDVNNARSVNLKAALHPGS